jgi:bifunctional DNA-binding transcriptional regulator/antitoxin component of YhaV-PrlF toxin-antitoxin module
MLVKPITISSKGQIALPRDVVKHLDSRMLKLEILNDNEVKIVPIKDVAGRLSAYAKNVSTDDFNKIREQAWEEAVEKRFAKENNND